MFIDARKLGIMIDRRHRQLTPEDIKKIGILTMLGEANSSTGKKLEYADVAGFCKTARLDEIRKQNYILTPGRYVGAEEEEEDEEAFSLLKQIRTR